jgi:hypothetical protein
MATADETPDVPDVDLKAFSTAVNGVLDDTQKFLGFPVALPPPPGPFPPTHQQPPGHEVSRDVIHRPQAEPPASANLIYDFQGSLIATLKTQWTLFDGFTLDEVSIGIALNASSSRMIVVSSNLLNTSLF